MTDKSWPLTLRPRLVHNERGAKCGVDGKKKQHYVKKKKNHKDVRLLCSTQMAQSTRGEKVTWLDLISKDTSESCWRVGAQGVHAAETCSIKSVNIEVSLMKGDADVCSIRQQ